MFHRTRTDSSILVSGQRWTIDEDLDLISQHVGFGMSNPGAIRVTGHPHTNVNRGRAPPATRLERLRELLSTSDKKKRGTRYSLPRLRRDAASTARAAVQPSTAGEKHAHAHTGLVGHHRLTLCAHALHMHIQRWLVPLGLGVFSHASFAMQPRSQLRTLLDRAGPQAPGVPQV
jgi:hypothetical protein